MSDGIITDVIAVRQLPIIEEHLANIADIFVSCKAAAQSMEATDENLAALKSTRAQMRKRFDELETARKGVKAKISEPYNAFESVYKTIVTDAFNDAEKEFKAKIEAVEEIKRKKKTETARKFYAEYAAAMDVADLVDWEHSDVAVNISKSDAAIMKEMQAEIDKIASDKKAALQMENGAEILFEYKRTHNLAEAIETVKARHAYTASSAPEETRPAEEAKPKVTEPERVYEMTFTVAGTIAQLRALKKYLADNGLLK